MVKIGLVKEVEVELVGDCILPLAAELVEVILLLEAELDVEILLAEVELLAAELVEAGISLISAPQANILVVREEQEASDPILSVLCFASTLKKLCYIRNI